METATEPQGSSVIEGPAPFGRILVAAASREDLEVSVPLAAALGGGRPCEIIVFHADDAGRNGCQPDFEGGREAWLAIVDELRLQWNVTARLVSRHGDPCRAIQEAARDEKADLIVVTPHQRRGLHRFLLGSCAEKLVRQSEISVLCAPYGIGSAHRIRRILVAVDRRGRAVAQAARLAAVEDATIELMEVVPRIGIPGQRLIGVDEHLREIGDEMLGIQRRDLEAWGRERIAPETKFLACVVPGDPITEILDRAHATAADLIVLATRRQTSPDEVFIGTVTERILRRSQCPVLAAR